MSALNVLSVMRTQSRRSFIKVTTREQARHLSDFCFRRAFLRNQLYGKQLALVALCPTGFLEIVQSECAFPGLEDRRACFHNRLAIRSNADLQ